MKTICISALLASTQAALRCVDERVEAADAEALAIQEEIKNAAALQTQAMTDASQTNSRELLAYQSVMNTLSVAVVSAKSYQLAAEEGADQQAMDNAYGSVTASMKAMAYEQGRTGSAAIKDILDEIREATRAVKVAEERRVRNEAEIISAENNCVVGQPGIVPPKNAQDELDFETKLASIPAQINLKQIIKSDVCPNNCRTNYETFEFESPQLGDQWLRDCLNQCDLEENVLDRDYSTWSQEQEKRAIVAAQIDTNKDLAKQKLGLDPQLPSNLSQEDILKQYQLDQDTVKLTFACRSTDDGVVCFDSNGQQVEIAVKKDGVSAEQFLKATPTTQAGVECNLYDKMFGMCSSAGDSAVRTLASYTTALMAVIVFVSSEQTI